MLHSLVPISYNPDRKLIHGQCWRLAGVCGLTPDRAPEHRRRGAGILRQVRTRTAVITISLSLSNEGNSPAAPANCPPFWLHLQQEDPTVH
ncbi:hypothetical protein SKAU_G00303290 [Synaphobranchus kaupii]|uniref:Uncharacterized protein n=1 Tax=Synaphobranchus kaupii TaxID=118154 RepID=A0A9Q1INI5_SYNKA|nr:hypothetical protein SKAU_G00303290 [Synaphobranchus kaupii]